jgi:C-terminal processing protease CtpA/Prc
MGCGKSKAAAREESQLSALAKLNSASAGEQPVVVSELQQTLEEHDAGDNAPVTTWNREAEEEKEEEKPKDGSVSAAVRRIEDKDLLQFVNEENIAFTFSDFTRSLGMHVTGDANHNKKHHQLLFVETLKPGSYAEELGMKEHTSIVSMERDEVNGIRMVADFSKVRTTEGEGICTDGTPMKTVVHRTRGLGMKLDAHRRVTAVDDGGQAAEQSIMVGDVVSTVDGVDYESRSGPDVIAALMLSKKAGQDAELLFNKSEISTGVIDFTHKITADFVAQVDAARVSSQRANNISTSLIITCRGHTQAALHTED